MNQTTPQTFDEILEQVRNGEDSLRGNFISGLRSLLSSMGFVEFYVESDGRWWQSLAAVHKNGYVMRMTSSVKRTERVTWRIESNNTSAIYGAFQSQTGLKRAVKSLVNFSNIPTNSPAPYVP